MDYEIVLSAIQMQLGLDDNTKAAAVALYNQYLAKSKAEKVLHLLGPWHQKAAQMRCIYSLSAKPQMPY